jgi:hypothetical protein
LNRYICLMLLLSVWLPACSTNPKTSLTSTAPLPHSMKGYELYSWPVDEEWHFTLITGTNRLKTVDEITTGQDMLDTGGWVKVSVVGLDTLKAVLRRLPVGESVFWVGGRYLFFDRLSLPPQAVIDELQVYCQELGLDLSVVE